jgi:hypothetical protein
LDVSGISEKIKNDPRNFSSLLELTEAFLSSGHIDQAARTLEVILKMESRSSITSSQVSSIVHILQKHLQSLYLRNEISANLRSVAYNRFDVERYTKLADSLRKIGRHQEADDLSFVQTLRIDLTEEFCPELLSIGLNMVDLMSFQETGLVDPESIRYVYGADSYSHLLAPPSDGLESVQHMPDEFSITETEFAKHVSDAYAYKIREASVWVDGHGTLVLDSQGRLLKDFSSGDMISMFLSPRPTPQHVDATLAFLSVKWGASFFHWMTDVMGRFAILYGSGFPLQEIDYFVIDYAGLPYQDATIALLGIPHNKIISSSRALALRAKYIIAPSSPGTPGWTQTWTAAFVRKIAAPIISNHMGGLVNRNNKIYISRNKARYRNIQNEDEVWSLLAARGFQRVFLEDMPFTDQILTMHAAEYIVAPHGAGLSNIIFCKPHARIVEIFSPEYVNVCYWILANACGLSYRYLLGVGGIDSEKFYPTKNIEVRTDRLSDILDNISA